MFQICPQNAVLIYSPMTEFYDERLEEMHKVGELLNIPHYHSVKVYLNSTSEMELVLICFDYELQTSTP